MNGRLQYRPGVIVEISGRKNTTVLEISAERFGVASLKFDGALEDGEPGHKKVKGALVIRSTQPNQKEWKETIYKVDTEVKQTEEQPFAFQVRTNKN